MGGRGKLFHVDEPKEHEQNKMKQNNKPNSDGVRVSVSRLERHCKRGSTRLDCG